MRKPKKEKTVREEGGRRERDRESKRRRRTERFGLEVGAGSQGWQGLVEECGGSEVLQREAPVCPAGALTMSCLTPPEPRPQTPSPLHHHHHRHPSNPKPTGRQRFTEAAAAAACLFNILKKLKYLCGLTHIHTQLHITHSHIRTSAHTFTHITTTIYK